MKIEYICHACLFIDTDDLKIATDPWFQGPAYCNQWHVFPKPVNTNILDASDLILLSHGHEDHLHETSLRQLPKNAAVLYPYTWCGGVRPYLKSMGFTTVTEAQHFETFHFTPRTSVTYLVNSLDSIMVVESNGEVLVNINDALHSSPPRVADSFIALLKSRWPRIDTVFCGFGGASYFPNTLHCPGKNDRETGEAREQLFARNFCRIVKDLDPRVAVPFAADFALLSPRQRWINEVRFSRSRLPAYFKELYRCTSELPHIQIMYSGDVLEKGRLIRESPYRDQFWDRNTNEIIEQQYRDEIQNVRNETYIEEPSAQKLSGEILANLRLRAKLFDSAVLEKLDFTVNVRDISERPYFNISFVDRNPRMERSGLRSNNSILEIQTSSALLRYSFANEWGGDAITIGYGCDIQVFDQSTIISNLDTICIRLLTRHPSSRWKVEPLRVLRSRWKSPVEFRDYSTNQLNEISRETLFRPKCEACRACDYLFAEQQPYVVAALS